MRCKFLSSLTLSAAILALLNSPLFAADEIRQLDASDASQAKDSASVGAKSKTPIPTPAKRKSGLRSLLEPNEPKAESANDAASKKKATSESEQAAEQSKAKNADDSLKPIPDAMDGGAMIIEPASFKGVTPGLSTQDDVARAWGQPKEIAKQNDEVLQLYTVEPFNRVEVSYVGNVVSSVVIRFDRSFPADTIAKQLDLATIRPVLVSGELGEVLGLSYPERGVLFAFEVGKEPDKPSMKVSQLILEPITAEPFVLRAETTLENRCDLCRRDLEQALTLEPDNARAHWLHGRVLVSMEQYDKAVTAAGRAVRLEADNARYRVTYAQVLAQVGRLSEASVEAEKAVGDSEKRPHVKARALCLVGDLAASGPKPDYRKALGLHTQSLQVADALTSDPHPAIRLVAKEVLVDAYLGAAHDIAWGDWKEKNKAVARWLERAVASADDLVKNEGGNREQVFRVHVRSMAAYVALRGGIDPQPTADAVVSVGDELIAATRDPVRKAQLQWDLGLALYDAVQISQMRSDPDNALKFGEKAVGYLAKANDVKQSPSSAFLLGRLYFRLGSIHATREKDHSVAVGWFDKAVPLLERPSADELGADLGRHGEAFVSMGVSYWETGQKQKGVTLSEKGIKWMEQAVKQGILDKSALTVPYNNLAAMHRKLGSTEKADRFQEMASGTKKEKLK